jgi:hypothetical protein
MATDEPRTYCPSGSLSGGGVCGSLCEGYCSVYVCFPTYALTPNRRRNRARLTECGRAELPAAASVWSRARAAKPTLLSTGARVRKWRWQPQHQPQARLRGRWSARGAQWLGSARLGSARLGSARLGSARLGLRSSCLHKVSALSSLACHSEQHWLCPSMHCGAFLGAVVHVCLGAFRSVSASAAPSAASSTRTADSTTSAATPCRFGHTSPPRPSVRPPACDHRRARSEPREGFPARRQQAASAVPQWGTGPVLEMGKWGTWAEWERRLACRRVKPRVDNEELAALTTHGHGM